MFSDNEQLKDIINVNAFPVIIYDFEMNNNHVVEFKGEIGRIKGLYRVSRVFIYSDDCNMFSVVGTVDCNYKDNRDIKFDIFMPADEFLLLTNDKDFKNLQQFNEKYRNAVIHGTCIFKKCPTRLYADKTISEPTFDYYIKIENVQQ